MISSPDLMRSHTGCVGQLCGLLQACAGPGATVRPTENVGCIIQVFRCECGFSTPLTNLLCQGFLHLAIVVVVSTDPVGSTSWEKCHSCLIGHCENCEMPVAGEHTEIVVAVAGSAHSALQRSSGTECHS